LRTRLNVDFIERRIPNKQKSKSVKDNVSHAVEHVIIQKWFIYSLKIS